MRTAATLLLLHILTTLVQAQAASQASPIPEDQDIAFQKWNDREKYYLIVAVDKASVPGADLPFAVTDATKVSEALENHGFKKLDDILTGSNATHDRFVLALQKAQCKDSSSLVLVYYSGHGVVAADNNELWLQLAGQPKLADRLGITVRDIVGSARGNCYSGELTLILDACFSGAGVLTSGLTMREFGTKTSILTSSSETEESYSTKQTDGTEISAFTDALIRAVTTEYESADDNSDGFLIWDELAVYSQNQLDGLLKGHTIPKKMEPYQITNPSTMFISYDRNHVKRWNSQIRQHVAKAALEDSFQLATLQTSARNRQSITLDTQLVVPEQARKIAREITAAPNSYVAGLKAIAEHRFASARKILSVACKESDLDLRNCYLALARNEMYAGKPLTAVAWYRRASSLSLPVDIQVQNEETTALLLSGRTTEGGTILKGLVDRLDALKLEDTRVATSLHNLATAQLYKGKLGSAEVNYARALDIYKKQAPDSTYASVTASGLAELYTRGGQPDKAVEYKMLSAQLLPPPDAPHSLPSQTFLGKVQEADGNITFVPMGKGQNANHTITVDNPEALVGYAGQVVQFKADWAATDTGTCAINEAGRADCTLRVMSQPQPADLTVEKPKEKK